MSQPSSAKFVTGPNCKVTDGDGVVVLLADTFLLLLLFLLLLRSTCTKLVVVRAAVVVSRTEAVALASQGTVVTISEKIMMGMVVKMRMTVVMVVKMIKDSFDTPNMVHLGS